MKIKLRLLSIICLPTILVTGCTEPYQTIHDEQPSQAVQQLPKYDKNARLQNLNKLSFFPKAKPKFNRNVIYLPKVANEQNLKVEFVIGLNVQTDCNYYQLVGDFQKKTLYGWGYPYYEISKLKGPLSTMINCPDTKKTVTFLRVAGTEMFQPYDSSSPMVVYAPSGLQIKYRVWESSPQEHVATVE